MNKAEQIELAKYINEYIYVQNCPHDAELLSAIECFYDETHKEEMLVSAEEQADFELEQLMNVNESDQLGLYR